MQNQKYQTHELSQRQRTNQGFRSEMQKANQNYSNLKKLAHYSNLSTVNQILISKFTPEKSLSVDTYFIYGIYINQEKVQMDLITSYFVTVFPRPKKPYNFVYFNDHDSPNNFSNFKNMLSIMPLDYFVNLQAIYLVRPSLKMKASRYFTFGTISKYINNKIVNIGNMGQLSQKLGVRQEQILHFLPMEVRSYFSQQQMQISPPVYLNVNNSTNKMGNNNTGQYRSLGKASNDANSPMLKNTQINVTQKPRSQLQPNSNNSNFNNNYNYSNSNTNQQKTNITPPPIKLQIDQYAKSQRGIPQFFQILLIYFREHNQELEQQGLFRKSVSIEQQTIALEKMHKKQYDYLEKVQDPHLVANLIKRFLSKLKTPIIPYKIFQQLMEKQPIDAPYIATKMKQLSYQNMTKYLTIMTLLDFMNRKVIPRSYKNKMTAQNIAICFAPCLMWAQQRSIKDLMYMNKSVALEIFGTKKEISKVYRSSFFEHQRKSISQAYGVGQNESKNKLEGTQPQQNRKTANFGMIILQKAQNQLKKLQQQHSDLSDNDIDHKQKKVNISVISPNKIKGIGVTSSSKSQIQKNELKKDQQLLTQVQSLSNQRKSQKANNPNSIHIPQDLIEIEPPTNTHNNTNKNKTRKNTYGSNIEPGSPRLNQETKDRVSSNKSNNQINSIHSDQ